MKELLAFMLDVPTIEGTVIEARIDKVCAVDHTTKAKYQLKSTSKSLSKSDALYTPE